MQRSTQRILTTHTGSLPRVSSILEVLRQRERGEPVSGDEIKRAALAATREVVDQQVQIGLDIVNDGEQHKPSYATYVIDRVAGFDGERRAVFPKRLDSVDFPEWARAAAPRGLAALRVPTCNGPLAWKDFDAVTRDIECLREATRDKRVSEVFMTAASPGVISVMLSNSYYQSREAYVFTLADIMRREYEAIADAGFVLQIDCPDLAMSHNSEFSDLSIPEFKKVIAMHVEALNHATANIAPDRMRMHLCWGNYEGPHNHDIALHEILPTVLRARPGALSFEAANPRHAHEWKVWRDIELPDDKVVIPGVLDTTTNYVEHPELVAQRIARYTRTVGKERVIAGADCGFGTMFESGGVDTRIVWAKLAALVEGAAIASRELW
ncbi:MAG TPA: cobalamin-independent methionine synthase II family protein [Acidimicrobiales bacterium]|nr:cobalamin-independent methionine synthase II family protein [Acidimicrobiales bacterium]